MRALILSSLFALGLGLAAAPASAAPLSPAPLSGINLNGGSILDQVHYRPYAHRHGYGPAPRRCHNVRVCRWTPYGRRCHYERVCRRVW